MQVPGFAVKIGGLALALAPICAASARPQAPIGTISVIVGSEASSADSVPYDMVAAAANALGDKGFTILNDPGHAAYVAEVIVTRANVGAAPVRIRTRKASVIGAGVNVPIGSGRSQIVALQRTELTINIRKRGAAPIVWHGAAVTVRSEGSPGGKDDAIASALSEAALRRYPYVSDAVTSVP